MSELSIETLTMPAADFGPANPLPSLLPLVNASGDRQSGPDAADPHPSYRTSNGCLPYLLKDGYNRLLRPRNFKAIVLENDFLRAAFLPELGGRLWSLLHKKSGRELVEVNPVCQPVNFALRNAWLSGGVEWNIGVIGHTAHTCSPLFAGRVDEAGTGPVLRLYEWDRFRGVPFQVDFFLPDRSQFLFARVRIVNPHDFSVPMYWWSNIAVAEKEDVRVIAPAAQAYRHDYKQKSGLLKVRVPPEDGPDTTYTSRSRYAGDRYFVIPEGRRAWITALDREGKGLIQASTSRLKGRKMFFWGTGPGGQHWQEFLSRPGHAYLELQAGLALTQSEYVNMPADSDWSWLEAYGLMETDPQVVHGPDWEAACETVEERLTRVLPVREMEEKLSGSSALADFPPEEMLHKGSGWGALERKRRGKAGLKPFCSAGLVFDDGTLSAEQEPYLKLLDEGRFPEVNPGKQPSGWMVQDEWREMLERAVENKDRDNWYSHLQLGVMYYFIRQSEKARNAWKKSLELKSSCWAYRNLAVLAGNEGDKAEAADLWLAAYRLRPDLYPLVIECCRALNEAGRQRETMDLFDRLRPELRGQGRIKSLAAQACLVLDRLDEVEELLRGIEIADLREGDTVLAEIWFGLQEKRLSLKENQAVDEALKERVRKDFPPPSALDFRMHG